MKNYGVWPELIVYNLAPKLIISLLLHLLPVLQLLQLLLQRLLLPLPSPQLRVWLLLRLVELPTLALHRQARVVSSGNRAPSSCPFRVPLLVAQSCSPLPATAQCQHCVPCVCC